MLDSLTKNQKLLGAAALAWLLFRDKGEAATQDLVPGIDPRIAIPPGGMAAGSSAPAHGDYRQGVESRRYAEGLSDAPRFNPDNDTVTVGLPVYYGVVGCCKAWATAYPSVRGATAGGGTMWSPKSRTGRRCGCVPPVSSGKARPWWLPIERANRALGRAATAFEFAPNDSRFRSGTAGVVQDERPGFQHAGRPYVLSTATRNFMAIHDADPDVLYYISTDDWCAYNKRTRRSVPFNAIQPRYKGRPVRRSPNPWAVEPWLGWMNGQNGGRGRTPLQKDDAPPERLPWDFVAPVYAWALLDNHKFVQLPFAGDQQKSAPIINYEVFR